LSVTWYDGAMLSRVVALSLGMTTPLFAFAAGVGLTGSWVGGATIGVIAAGLVGFLFWRRPPFELDESAPSRGLAIVSGLSTALAHLKFDTRA
jgi:hypothetical protein